MPVDPLDVQDNGLSAAILRVIKATQAYVMKAHVTELLMQKVTSAKELYQAAKASCYDGFNATVLQELLERAQQRAMAYVHLNNSFCEAYPKEGKKLVNIDSVLNELITGLHNCMKVAPKRPFE